MMKFPIALARFIDKHLDGFIFGVIFCLFVTSFLKENNKDYISKESNTRSSSISSQSLDSKSESSSGTKATRKTTSRNVKPSGETTEVIIEESIDQHSKSLLLESERKQAAETLQKYESLKAEISKQNDNEFRLFGGIGLSSSFKIKAVAGFNLSSHGSLLTTDSNKDHAIFYTYGKTFR